MNGFRLESTQGEATRKEGLQDPEDLLVSGLWVDEVPDLVVVFGMVIGAAHRHPGIGFESLPEGGQERVPSAFLNELSMWEKEVGQDRYKQMRPHSVDGLMEDRPHAPMMAPDLPTATVTRNSGTSVHNGSTVTAEYTTTYIMDGTTLSPNVAVKTSVGSNMGTYTNTSTHSISAPTTQTCVYPVSAVSGNMDNHPGVAHCNRKLRLHDLRGNDANSVGNGNRLVGGQILSEDGLSALWSTTATSEHGISGTIMTSLGNPYSGDYTVVQAPGNATALMITAATSTSGSSGSGTQGGITVTNFNPFLQTVDLFRNFPPFREPLLPETSPIARVPPRPPPAIRSRSLRAETSP